MSINPDMKNWMFLEGNHGGQFAPAEGGQFESATHGQFKSAEGGQIDRSLQSRDLNYSRLINSNHFFVSIFLFIQI